MQQAVDTVTQITLRFLQVKHIIWGGLVDQAVQGMVTEAPYIKVLSQVHLFKVGQ